MSRQSKIWIELKTQMVLLHLARFDGEYSYTMAGGVLHFWTPGIPHVAWCNRNFRQVNKELAATEKVCLTCWDSFQKACLELIQSDVQRKDMEYSDTEKGSYD